MAGDDDDAVMLEELADQRHVVEILDLLSESGCNVSLLTRFVPARNSELATALRMMAAHGLLADDRGGSDEPLTIPGTLRLTARGEAAAQALSNRANADNRGQHSSALGRATGRVLTMRRAWHLKGHAGHPSLDRWGHGVS
ncbi:hypothetical protein [Nocardia sp. NBC_01327]|uniref:hypothetical protein n=1 Tax=Nocardia sp. NBC_01327 TaxID=2903593 RepID=UPI002E131E7F|nr:hypothetical protein OG326_15925 [Nocardia sp. NBC_01327]